MNVIEAGTKWRLSPFTPEFGVIVEAGQRGDLLSIDLDEVMNLFRSSGMILFRGFAPGDAGFAAFTDRFTDRFTGHVNRRRTPLSEDGTLMTVTPGTDLLRAHAEMAYTPLRPDVLWFHCVRPASEGGETFVVDGVRVVEEMTQRTRDLLLRKRIKYRYPNVQPGERLQWLLQVDDFESALRVLDTWPGFTYKLTAAGTIDAKFLTPAIKRTRYGQQLAFNASILDVAGDFEDDTPIPDEVMQELDELTTRLARLIHWRPDEVAMIDNTRMLHGRMAFTDPARTLHVRMGNLEM